MLKHILVLCTSGFLLTSAYSQGTTEFKALKSVSDDPAVYENMPVEVNNIQLATHPITIISDEYELGDWQETPSKIIFHEAYYHMWIIDIPLRDSNNIYRREGISTTRYLKSKDCIQWLDQGLIPLGEAGSIDDRDRLAPDVVKYEGKFYMFYEAIASNSEEYGQRCGIACLVAEKPEGPWEYATKERLVLKASSDNPDAFDHSFITNPRIEFLNGTWFMYYKARNLSVPYAPNGYETQNGIATADNLLGPYTKYEDNPITMGHSAYLLKYKNGLIYVNMHPQEILWTEDGFNFIPVKTFERDPRGFETRWSSVHLPNNPLYGGDASLPDASEFIGITSSWRKEFGYRPLNNDIIGLKIDFKGVAPSRNNQDIK